MIDFTETDRHFIDLLQNTINRMANNSANCKNWFMAVVAAVIAFVANNPESANVLLVLLFVDLLFYCLDSYYLQLEKDFRDIECNFVKALNDSTSDRTQINMLLLYNFNYSLVINDSKKKEKNIYKALKSPSTWPFYSSFFILIIIVYCCIADCNIINWIASLNDSCSCCQCCK